MVILRWAVPFTRCTGHLLAVHDTLAGSVRKDRYRNVIPHLPYTAYNATVLTPVYANSDLVGLLRCLRVSALQGPYNMLCSSWPERLLLAMTGFLQVPLSC